MRVWWLIVSVCFATLLHGESESGLFLKGEEIFSKRCASCHQAYIPQLLLNSNYEHNNTDLNLTAPTLTELSFALKDQVGDRKGDVESQLMEIEAFLQEYISHPDSNRSIFPADVRKHFNQMPPMKLSEDEAEALAVYMRAFSEKMMVEHGVKRYSYAEALQKAKEEGKIIMIEGYIPFCRWCMRMDREVMVEPEVKAALERDFVLVKMNLLTQKLPLGLQRLGTPSFYFIKSNGKEVIDAIEGFGNKREFLDLLKQISADAK